MRASLFWLSCMLSFGAGTAHAQDASSARGRFQQGVQAMHEGDPSAAAQHFEASYALEPRAATLCNLAVALDRAGGERRAEAIEKYQRCAQDDQSGRFVEHALVRERELRDALEQERLIREELARQAEETRRAEALRETQAREATSQQAAAEHAPNRNERGDVLPDPGAEKTSSWIWASIGVAGGAAVALGGAIGFSLDARADYDDLKDSGGVIVDGSAEEETLENAESKATAGYVLYWTAAGLAAVSGFFLVLGLTETRATPSEEPRAESTADITLAPFGLGASLTVAID